MAHGPGWKILSRYLAGEASESERQRIAVWLAEDGEHETILRELEAIWESPESSPLPSDIGGLWASLAKKAGIGTEGIPSRIPAEKAPERGKRRLFPVLYGFSPLQKIAAVFALGLLLPLLVYFGLSFIQRGNGWQEVQVARGTQQRFTLPDGTLVTLDAGSIFAHPKHFDGPHREVWLQGEGYFEVRHDAQKAFVVQADFARVKVLGTKFNVRAWPGSRRIDVSVQEGRVALRARASKSGHGAVLSGGNVGILTAGSLNPLVTKADIMRQLGWMQRQAQFENVPLREVLDQLERWYDVRFDLHDSALASEQVTVYMAGKSLAEHLELLGLLVNAEFLRAGQLIEIRKKTKD